MWILLSVALASDATCDGIDDDYDGLIDEDAACSTQLGVCSQQNIAGHSFIGCVGSAPMPRSEARLECTSIGYLLAGPMNTEENVVATSLLPPDADYWLGVNDQGSEGAWMNITGQAIPFTAWMSGQPNGGILENCVTLGPGTPPQLWTDHDCDDANTVLGFVCEARCDPVIWYDDLDADGYGGASHVSCSGVPNGSVSLGGDCADDDVYRNPGVGFDGCNGIDDDCDGDIDEDVPPLVWYADFDTDGYGDADTTLVSCLQPVDFIGDASDCDDADASAFPGATEVCDGDLEDCNGTVDAGLTSTFYSDGDGDGFGDPSEAVQACTAPIGYVVDSTDCDDSDNTAFPGATEVCDGDLEDCDGSIDAGLTATYWLDHDGDGFGDANSTIQACSLPSGYSPDSTDCDDGNPTIFLGAVEICDGEDNNCNGQTDEGVLTTFWDDNDADGYGNPLLPITACTQPGGAAGNALDCDDNRSSAFPGAPELCNNLDDDCDGDIDNGTNDVQWYVDGDGDGFGDATGAFQCEQPSGQVSTAGDCNDSNPAINPTAHELCDGTDHDCDGEEWNGLTIRELWPDSDGDGYGAGTSTQTCEASLPGYVANGEDCDDIDDLINPAAVEICDMIDNDCDGLTDDADTVPNPNTWYPDTDEDDFGDPDHPIQACAQPPGTTDRAGDCDDNEPNVFEGAPEACADGLDNDCDGLIDADDPDFVNGGVAYAQDNDDDNFGDPFNSALACSGEQPLGWVPLSLGEDCDDGDSLRNPGLDEICDGIDNDCVGGVDNGLFFLDYFLDDDADGFGDPNSATINACAPIAGRSSNGLDCDDADPLVNPNATEICNGEDDNCNVLIDDGLDSEDYYPDADGDGFGDALAEVETRCSTVSGKVTDHTDCDDTDSHIYPGATEDPIDGIDSDCDGTVEEAPPAELPDTDGDGVPDTIDLIDPTGDPAPTPPPKHYGCGCTSTTGARSWVGWMRRR